MVKRLKDHDADDQESGTNALDQVLVVIGERIKAARLKNNLTQSELAEKVGCSKSWVFLTEDGQQNVKINSLYRVAVALGISIQSLLPPPPHGSEAGNPSDVDDLATAAMTDLNGTIDQLNTTIRNLYGAVSKMHQIKAVQSKQ